MAETKEMTMELEKQKELEKEIDSKEEIIAKEKAIFMACKKRLGEIKPKLKALEGEDIGENPEQIIDYIILTKTTETLLKYQKFIYDELIKEMKELDELYAELYKGAM